ncbi:MAG: acyl carrier protein [Acidobacteriota bacterium]
MPTSPSIEQAVIEVLKDVSRRPIDPSSDSDLLADLGFDSLQIMETVAELENRFGVSMPLDDLAGTRTVAQIVARLTALVEGGR